MKGKGGEIIHLETFIFHLLGEKAPNKEKKKAIK
jgi:hypothetical protein